MPNKKIKAHKSPLDPKTEQILADYGIQERLGRPRERILKWVAVLHKGIHATLSEGAEPEALLADMLSSDLRLVIFYLEGILKLYRKRYPDLEKSFAAVKALEDSLGVLSAAQGFLTFAIEHKSPAAAVAHLEEQVHKAHATTLSLVQKEWMPKPDGCVPTLKQVTQTLQGLKFDKYKKDKKVLQAEIVRRLKKFEKLEFDMNVLQGDFGIHELRRQLRWFPIYATALDGLFVHSDEKNPIDEYEALLQSELAESKYSQLPPADRETKPFAISKSIFVANNGFISELGSIKDRGEEIEAIEHALMATGKEQLASRAQAIKIIGLPEDAFEEVLKDAQVIFDEIERVRFRKVIRKDVEKA